eukprot:1158120-Pelagomonas_calceolata.AAC.10
MQQVSIQSDTSLQLATCCLSCEAQMHALPSFGFLQLVRGRSKHVLPSFGFLFLTATRQKEKQTRYTLFWLLGFDSNSSEGEANRHSLGPINAYSITTLPTHALLNDEV